MRSGYEKGPKLLCFSLPGLGGELLQEGLGVFVQTGHESVYFAEKPVDLLLHDAADDGTKEAG